MPFALIAFSLDKLQNIGFAILGLGLLIFLHEFGHFLAAKRMAMPVETFSIGFGPRLFGFKWKETDVRLSAIPLGGYVKLAGFNPEEPGAEDPHGFLKQPFGKRMLFYSGGILMNLLVAFVAFTVVGISRAGYTAPVRIGEVVAGSAAEAAGLKAQDQLLAVGPYRFPGSRWEEAVDHIRANPGNELVFEIRRGGQDTKVPIRPANNGGIGQVGIKGQPIGEGIQRPFRWSDIGEGVQFSGGEIKRLSGLVFGFLKTVVSFQAKASQVSGPVGMVSEMAKSAGAGWMPFTYFLAFISLQLAILNALPIPMLDGGHMLLLTIEKVRRRDLSMAFKERLLAGGFYLLMGLMGLVVFLDFWKMRK